MSNSTATRPSPLPNITRREAIAIAAAAAVAPAAITAEDRVDDLDTVSPVLSRFPRVGFDRALRLTRANHQKANKRFKDVTDREDAVALAAAAREDAIACLTLKDIVPPDGPPPHEIVGTLTQPAFRIDKIVYESLPGYKVSASLYVPSGGVSPMPAVLGVCGHAMEGKAAEAYQSFAQALAISGFVVLVIDPIGQAERLVSPEKRDGKWRSALGGATTQHNEVGNRLGLTGNFFGGLRLLDGVRGIDLLESLDIVDASRIGVTGNSGGGTMTTWITAVDDRVAFSAPSCFVTSFLRNLENELPADSEQCPPQALAKGLDHAGFLAGHAPKPLLLIGQRHDFFDYRGTAEAFLKLRSLYEQFDAADNVHLYIGDEDHGYHRQAREQMVNFFRKAAGIEGETTEPELTLYSEEQLRCFPEGQAEPAGSRSPLSLIADIVAELPAEPLPFANRSEAEHPLPAIRVLRSLRGIRGTDFLSRYHLTGRDGIRSIVYRVGDHRMLGTPPKSETEAALYIADRSSYHELRDERVVAKIMALIGSSEEATLYAIDLPGIGEFQPRLANPGSVRDIYGSDYMLAAYGEMNDRPIIEDRIAAAADAIAWLRLLGHRDVIPFTAPQSSTGTQITTNLIVSALSESEPAKRAAAAATTQLREIAISTEGGTLPPLSCLPFGILGASG